MPDVRTTYACARCARGWEHEGIPDGSTLCPSCSRFAAIRGTYRVADLTRVKART